MQGSAVSIQQSVQAPMEQQHQSLQQTQEAQAHQHLQQYAGYHTAQPAAAAASPVNPAMSSNGPVVAVPLNAHPYYYQQQIHTAAGVPQSNHYPTDARLMQQQQQQQQMLLMQRYWQHQQQQLAYQAQQARVQAQQAGAHDPRQQYMQQHTATNGSVDMPPPPPRPAKPRKPAGPKQTKDLTPAQLKKQLQKAEAERLMIAGNLKQIQLGNGNTVISSTAAAASASFGTPESASAALKQRQYHAQQAKLQGDQYLEQLKMVSAKQQQHQKKPKLTHPPVQTNGRAVVVQPEDDQGLPAIPMRHIISRGMPEGMAIGRTAVNSIIHAGEGFMHLVISEAHHLRKNEAILKSQLSIKATLNRLLPKSAPLAAAAAAASSSSVPMDEKGVDSVSLGLLDNSFRDTYIPTHSDKVGVGVPLSQTSDGSVLCGRHIIGALVNLGFHSYATVLASQLEALMDRSLEHMEECDQIAVRSFDLHTGQSIHKEAISIPHAPNPATGDINLKDTRETLANVHATIESRQQQVKLKEAKLKKQRWSTFLHHTLDKQHELTKPGYQPKPCSLGASCIDQLLPSAGAPETNGLTKLNGSTNRTTPSHTSRSHKRATTKSPVPTSSSSPPTSQPTTPVVSSFGRTSRKPPEIDALPAAASANSSPAPRGRGRPSTGQKRKADQSIDAPTSVEQVEMKEQLQTQEEPQLHQHHHEQSSYESSKLVEPSSNTDQMEQEGTGILEERDDDTMQNDTVQQ